jgi:hypothetical protein
MYLNGISQTVTEYVAASGTVTDNADSYFLGNRGSGDRIENCLLAEFAVWDRILTATEAMQIYYSKLPSTIDGCVLYVPVLGVSPEPDYITGGTQTVTGALPQNHPPQFERYQSATYQTRPRAFGAGIAR